MYDNKKKYFGAKLSDLDFNRVIEMAWEDRTPFDAIEVQFGLSESQVIQLMRSNLKTNSYKLWRKRVAGRKTKHSKLSNHPNRHKCPTQGKFRSR